MYYEDLVLEAVDKLHKLGQRIPTEVRWIKAHVGHIGNEEADEAALAQQEGFLANIFDSQSSAFYTSGRMMDDGMIDPRDTRRTLGFLLETVWETHNRTVKPNSFGIARM